MPKLENVTRHVQGAPILGLKPYVKIARLVCDAFMTISRKLAHILNNKLQVIIGMIDMALVAEGTQLSPVALSYLESAKKACRDTSEIIGHNIEFKLPSDKEPNV